MTEPSTCGQGLAEHAALHRQLARLLEAMVLNLELHLTAGRTPMIHEAGK